MNSDFLVAENLHSLLDREDFETLFFFQAPFVYYLVQQPSLPSFQATYAQISN
jgi:uncharacterized membrane protein